ncbi:MAG TPA: hypothetical protein VIP57_18125 [Candidatus Dormibacteraeota bacterium]
MIDIFDVKVGRGVLVRSILTALPEWLGFLQHSMNTPTKRGALPILAAKADGPGPQTGALPTT